MRPLASYGHRISMTISGTDAPRWGGAWLPPYRGQPPRSEEAIDELALKWSPREVLPWEAQCEAIRNQLLERHDPVPIEWVFQLPPPTSYQEIGGYEESYSARGAAGDDKQDESTLESEIPMVTDVTEKPPLPFARDGLGLHLDPLWEVHRFRQTAAARWYSPHPPLPPLQPHLAGLKYEDPTQKVGRSRFAELPLTPVWHSFVRYAEHAEVEY